MVNWEMRKKKTVSEDNDDSKKQPVYMRLIGNELRKPQPLIIVLFEQLGVSKSPE